MLVLLCCGPIHVFVCHTDCATKEEAQLYFQELRSQGKSIRILVTGQVGQGKSKLVNSFIGEPQAEERFGSRSATQNVEKFTKNIGGVEVTLIDTPGFSDPRKTDRDIIGEISKESDEIDLVLFCVRMDRRMQKADYRIMRKLTRAFGKAIWHNVLFVLTFANKVDAAIFARTRAEWEDDLREIARTKGEVPADIVQKIPVIVAGNEEESLPGCESWFTEFWLRAFTRTKDNARAAYLTLTLGLNKLDLQDSDDDDSLENSLEIGVFGRREVSLQMVEEHVGRACEEIKMNRVQCDAKPKTRRRHVNPHSSRRPQQKDITNPDTGATRYRPTLVPDTGATRHRPTPVPDTGATPCPPNTEMSCLRVLKAVLRALRSFFSWLFSKMSCAANVT